MTRNLLAALLFVTIAAAQPGKPAASFKDLKFGEPGRIRVPEVIRFQLPNGMTVMLVEDSELPTINLNAMIRAGSRWEPAAKTGLASIAGTVMRTGGSTTRNGDQLDRELDRLAASVEVGLGGDSGSASIFCLKEDIDKALPILADLLQHPAFPEDKIELAKIEQRDNIARRNDDPQGIAFREYTRALYGKDTPYGRQTEYATIKAITRDDLAAFHRQYFQPESVILGAWGDFKAPEMRAKIERAFAGWQRGGHPRPSAPPVQAAAGSRGALYLVDKDDVNQSTVIVGRLATRSDDPDHCALTVMNGVLGDGFASRLFSQVRSEQALAYAVWSSWGGEYEFPGVFSAFGGTKSETTVKIVGAIRHEIDRMAKDPVSDDELARSKDSILKGMAFEFDSTGKILGRLMTYEFYGYPRDFLQRYQDGIRAVTKADVLRVAKQYLKSDQFTVVVLGKEKDFEAPLSGLGKVTKLDLTIPPEPRP
uniref:Peptidase M16 domain protein n=1 Tax=Solibacter usitatus (strain Ellin6076) TaxID=234267 RepID=Q01PI9_SOLUE